MHVKVRDAKTWMRVSLVSGRKWVTIHFTRSFCHYSGLFLINVYRFGDFHLKFAATGNWLADHGG